MKITYKLLTDNLEIKFFWTFKLTKLICLLKITFNQEYFFVMKLTKKFTLSRQSLYWIIDLR